MLLVSHVEIVDNKDFLLITLALEYQLKQMPKTVGPEAVTLEFWIPLCKPSIQKLVFLKHRTQCRENVYTYASLYTTLTPNLGGGGGGGWCWKDGDGCVGGPDASQYSWDGYVNLHKREPILGPRMTLAADREGKLCHRTFHFTQLCQVLIVKEYCVTEHSISYQLYQVLIVKENCVKEHSISYQLCSVLMVTTM